MSTQFIQELYMMTLKYPSPLLFCHNVQCITIQRMHNFTASNNKLYFPYVGGSYGFGTQLAVYVSYPKLLILMMPHNYATSTRRFESSSSSAGDNNWFGPSLSPLVTFPEIWSCSVNFGMPCISAAHEIGVFSSITDFIAAIIASLVHCFLFLTSFSTFMVAGTDLGRGLPMLR